MRPARGRRTPLLVVVLLALALTSGACVSLPSSGPVVEVGEDARDGAAPGYSYVPQPPQPGAPPGQVVRGFLDAMTATPLQTAVASQFLATDARAQWEPEQATITYDEVSDPAGSTTVAVRLRGAGRLDARGAWQGLLPPERSTLRFPMVEEDGEWRIARAPDALVVPESWFGQRFRSVDLFFLDPTAQVLVPEPVFAPRGEQLATTLVQRLVAGPGQDLRGVARTFFPPGSAVELSVVVGNDGLAEVSLQGDPRALTGRAAELVLAQLAWTLRQDPSVRSLRLTVAGEPVTASGGPSEVSVDSASAFDPTLVTSSSQLFGLREGAVVVASPGAEEAVTGPLGSGDYQLRDLAVDLTATRVAGVAADGSAVWVAPLDAPAGGSGGGSGGGGRGADAVVTWPGTDMLRPGWDHADRLWLLDAAPGGARLSVVTGGRRRVLQASGVSGRRISQLLVSRDGSRLVTVLDRGADDVVQVSRVSHDERGRVLGIGRPVRLGRAGGEPLAVRDVGWSSSTDLVVAHALTGDLSELRTLPVDGSPASLDPEGSTDLLRERVLQLAGSPVPGEPLYVATPAGLLEPASAAGDVLVPPDVTAVTYVG